MRLKLGIMFIFALAKKWHRGRVARHSSAKACTAVRIRSMPPKPSYKGGFFVYIFLRSKLVAGIQEELWV